MWHTDRTKKIGLIERPLRSIIRCSFVGMLGIVVGLPLISSRARAQELPPTPQPPVSPRLFPHPTGMNAYEEWVQAGDLIRNNSALDDALDGTLTVKRRLLGDATVRQALTLLGEGMNKPVVSPHANIDYNTTFPELILFRRLARLLKVEMYVQFADGRSDAAIDTFAQGMRFGHQIQGDTLISGLVGIAIQNIVIREFTAHADQLSEYQCQRVRRIVEDWQTWHSPYPGLLNAEKNSTLRMLEQNRNNVQSLVAFFTAFIPDTSDENNEPDPDTEREIKRLKNLIDQVKQQPNGANDLLDQMENQVRASYDTAIATAQLPVWQRKTDNKKATSNSTANDNNQSLAESLSEELMPIMGPALNSYDKMDAQMRILGTRAAINAYRWEYSRLPNTLLDLHLGKLCVDPFTGTPFQYKRNGNSFELTSKGVPTP